MTVRPGIAPAQRLDAGQTVSLCSPGCAATLDTDPACLGGPATDTDPVCGMSVDTVTAAAHRAHADAEVFLCGLGCAERLEASPEMFMD